MTSATRHVLCIAAHPDDEVLGFGGSAFTMAQRGSIVSSCIVVGQAEARANRPDIPTLQTHIEKANAVIGARVGALGTFPNIRLNTVPHLELVQFIEQAIQEIEPDVLVTHHPSDVNDDHGHVARACHAAARLPQRRSDVKPIQALFYMEVLSSTDWGFSAGTSTFSQRTYLEIGESGLKAKLEALACYSDVMRPYPHPRSEESVRALATLRGSESGLYLAEAFEVGLQILDRL